jgi:hypothetical protein
VREPIRRSVLDAPHARGMTEKFAATHSVIASEAKQSRMLPRRQSGLLRRLRSSQ